MSKPKPTKSFKAEEEEEEEAGHLNFRSSSYFKRNV